MNKSKRHTAACWLSMLLFAVATADMAANAQTGSCTVTGLMGDHYHQSPNFKIKVSFRDHPVFVIHGVEVAILVAAPRLHMAPRPNGHG